MFTRTMTLFRLGDETEIRAMVPASSEWVAAEHSMNTSSGVSRCFRITNGQLLNVFNTASTKQSTDPMGFGN